MPLFGSTRYEVSKERPDSVSFAEQARAMGELIRSGKVLQGGSHRVIGLQGGLHRMGELIRSGKVR